MFYEDEEYYMYKDWDLYICYTFHNGFNYLDINDDCYYDMPLINFDMFKDFVETYKEKRILSIK